MAIQITCDNCHAAFQLKDELAGKRIRCPGCKQIVAVPPPKDTAPPESASRKGKSLTSGTRAVPPWTSGVVPVRRITRKSWWVAGGAALLLVGSALGLLFWLKGGSNESTANPKGDEKQVLKDLRGYREIIIKVVVVDLHSEPIPDAPGITWTSKEKFLIIYIDTYNRSDRQHLSFQDWRLSDVTLRDNAGKTYKKWSPPFGVPEPSRSVGPGDGLIIPVAFVNPPEPNIEYLDLELPEGFSDPKARIRFRIPKDMVRFK